VGRLLRGHYSSVIAVRTHSSIPSGSPLLRPKPRSRSLCRLLPAPAAGGTFPTFLCESFPGCLGPCHGGSADCTCLFLLHVIGLPPYTIEVGFPRLPSKRFLDGSPFSRLQPFLYVQAPKFARLPDRSYRCDPTPQSSRGFYIRAEHASFPLHASDMLTTRTQAIGGVGTYTPRDSQPCRLLQCYGELRQLSREHTIAGDHPGVLSIHLPPWGCRLWLRALGHKKVVAGRPVSAGLRFLRKAFNP